MVWALTGFGLALVIVIMAGAVLALCKSTRTIWCICEEWRQKLSWLWAPREEKVGLVKAQHPTAQTMPGLHRQGGNISQHLLHSDSDLRLDAQGAFTRFEAVDRDLHPPLGNAAASTIPPQPLRPAPQPKPLARPRPSPLQAPNTTDYIRLQEAGPGPLTPPPSLQSTLRASLAPSRYTTTSKLSPASIPTPDPSIFLFQNKSINNSDLYNDVHAAFRFDTEATKPIMESIQTTPHTTQNHHNANINETDLYLNDRKEYTAGGQSATIGYGMHVAPISDMHGNLDIDENNLSYDSYDMGQRGHDQMRRHVRNDGRDTSNTFGLTNYRDHANITKQSILECMYGPQTVTKMLHKAHDIGANELDQKDNRVSDSNADSMLHMFHSSPSKSRSYQRMPQYIENLPDHLVYDATKDRYDKLYMNTVQVGDSETDITVKGASCPVPSPLAPLEPPTERLQKDGPTTGERIFSALRSVTSQSYIDASEFYNSVRSSAEQVQHFTFARSRSRHLMNEDTGYYLGNEVADIYTETDADANMYDYAGAGVGAGAFAGAGKGEDAAADADANANANADADADADVEADAEAEANADADADAAVEMDVGAISFDGTKRSSDLYSPELNLEAHRTAQEVYNSLQDPPSSPLLLKDHNHDSYTYLSDPSFTRTSEEIFNSLEQRRKSMERLNGIHDFTELDEADSTRFEK